MTAGCRVSSRHQATRPCSITYGCPTPFLFLSSWPRAPSTIVSTASYTIRVTIPPWLRGFSMVVCLCVCVCLLACAYRCCSCSFGYTDVSGGVRVMRVCVSAPFVLCVPRFVPRITSRHAVEARAISVTRRYLPDMMQQSEQNMRSAGKACLSLCGSHRSQNHPSHFAA